MEWEWRDQNWRRISIQKSTLFIRHILYRASYLSSQSLPTIHPFSFHKAHPKCGFFWIAKSSFFRFSNLILESVLIWWHNLNSQLSFGFRALVVFRFTPFPSINYNSPVHWDDANHRWEPASEQSLRELANSPQEDPVIYPLYSQRRVITTTAFQLKLRRNSGSKYLIRLIEDSALASVSKFEWSIPTIGAAVDFLQD